MSENSAVPVTEEITTDASEGAEKSENNKYSNEDEVNYHAVEKEGSVTAIWEMQGKVHLRTIDPRSSEGKKILSLFETAA